VGGGGGGGGGGDVRILLYQRVPWSRFLGGFIISNMSCPFSICQWVLLLCANVIQ